MTHTHQRPADDIAVVGVDIGMDIFHLVGFDGRGKIVFRRKIKRPALIDTFIREYIPILFAQSVNADIFANASAD